MTSCIAHEKHEYVAPRVGSINLIPNPIPSPGETESRAEVINPAPHKAQAGGEYDAGIEVVEQFPPLRENELPVIEREHFQSESAEQTEPGHVLLEMGGLDSRRGLQPGTDKPPRISSPSLQLRNDLSDHIVKLRVSRSTLENLQQIRQSDPIVDQADDARKRKKRKNTNCSAFGADKKLKSSYKRKRSQPRTMEGADFSSLNKIESIRLSLLRPLMNKAGISLDVETLRKIYNFGDRIINETNAVLNDWSVWLSRELQPLGALFPPYCNLSSAEIIVAAYRLLAATHNTNHHGSVHRRLARIILHIFVDEFVKEVRRREDNYEVLYQRHGRSPVTIAHDLILEAVGEFERNGDKWNRGHIVDDRNLGKRWWRLGSGVGMVVILTCASDLATSHMETRGFTDVCLELLVNYMRNAYPSAVVDFQSLDPAIRPFFANMLLPPNDLVRLHPTWLQYDALLEKVQWTDTESTMATATNKLLRNFRLKPLNALSSLVHTR